MLRRNFEDPAFISFDILSAVFQHHFPKISNKNGMLYMSNLQLFTNLIAIVELNEEEQDPLCMFLFDDIKSQQGQDPDAIQLVEEIKEHKRVSLSTIEPTCYTKDL